LRHEKASDIWAEFQKYTAISGMKKIRLCFATNNLHKLEEVRAILPEEIELLSLKEIGCFEELPENQRSLEGNALEKAAFVHQKYGIDCFADDTGLEAEGLNGEPGVDTAHYAGPERDAEKNMSLLLKNLEGSQDRKASFRTIFCLVWQGETYSFEGRVNGEISGEKKGSGGFGYDPVFIPDGYSQTFAELGPEIKNRFSHRAEACRQLAAFFKTAGIGKI
jgi:XTP/dITP diphosphohydrolase